MTNPKIDFNLVNSTLTIKASGSLDDEATMDLLLPQGKSIAQLLYDQENFQDPQNLKEESKEENSNL